MAGNDLEENSLYIMLFLRSHPPIPNDFHWAFYFHRGPNDGMKYHVRQQGNSGWMADHGATAGVMKGFLLVGLFKIGDVPADLKEHIDGIMRAYDDKLNVSDVICTCRIWLLWILTLLQTPIGGKRILRTDDLKALEDEVKTWGNENAIGASNNEQPRPIAVSSILYIPEDQDECRRALGG
ncbi:hypothetical protein McanMca71_003855 [Microsporum canis]|uniref:Uncharacterized protein n=1 Tax=Arthroderma otae (strain ATCC MYA-4605 / CBS 113480) TaxID=554155 RepID=C5FV64_ARTOC|nr:conserved hypothetical protein [Microsporum canis CBS 113480]EEQ33798.1 conserved hypothetical protein [Microsporum canis CBS 113480]